MLVGDIKQSIYRWRGGNTDLLLNAPTVDFPHFHEITHHYLLNTNYRSYPAIVHFNNQFFQSLLQFLSESSQSEKGKDTKIANFDSILEIYEDFKQFSKYEHSTGGGVYLELIHISETEETNKKAAYRATVLPKLEATLAQLLEQGYLPKEITILVRSGEEGKWLADSFNNRNINGRIIQIFTNDAMMVGSSLKVLLLIRSMQYLYNPAHTLNKTELLYTYCRYHLQSPFANEDLNALFTEMNRTFEAQMPEKLTHPENAIRLKHLPLQGLTEELIRIYELHQEADAFLQHFEDLVLHYQQEFGSNLGTFLDWWNETGKSTSIQLPDNENALPVLTIHKAKGLEFPVAILPFAAWEIKHKGTDIAWLPMDSTPYQQFPFLPVQMSKSLQNTCFKSAYDEDYRLNLLDNLNLLYVALTRPIERLYLFTDLQASSSTANWLKGTVEQLANQNELTLEISENSHIYRAGNLTSRDYLGKSKEKKPDFSAYPLMSYLNYPWSDKLIVKSKALEVLHAQKSGADSPKELSKQLRGTFIHEILADLTNITELPVLLSQKFRTNEFTTAEQDAITLDLHNILALPQMQKWFAEPWQAINEKAILLPAPIEHQFTYRPDKVLVHDNDTVILEFKTGSDKQTLKHEQQLRQYGEILTQMGYSNPDLYLVYIGLGVIRQVERT